jgi:coenzyme F420-reducing hydrogenase beta subunit
MGSWVQCELLRLGLVDHVINVASRPPDSSDRRLFAYRIASSPAAVREGAKSKYYPIELSEVLATVRREPGRYALVGLPCFIKAARLLCRQEPVLAERLRWFVGLVCGHLKSMRFAELMAWQMGIRPADLVAFDFRVKLPARPANEYGMKATGLRNGAQSTGSSASRHLLGSDWGLGFFQYKACDFCDDVFAEVADIVVGDAWLPRFSQDPGGTNILVVRRPELDQIVREAAEQGRLRIESLAVDEVAQSQAAGLRHRRDGLRYRLHQARERDEWFPPKRVVPARVHLSRSERARYRLRERLRDLSHAAFAKALAADDLSAFASAVQPLVATYRRHRLTAAQRLRRKATHLAWVLAARLRSLLTRLTGRLRER